MKPALALLLMALPLPNTTAGTAPLAAKQVDAPLIFLTQIMPKPGHKDAGAQLKNVMGRMSHLLEGCGGSPGSIARLHLYAANAEAADAAMQQLPSYFPDQRIPPVSLVETALPDPADLISVDVVAAQERKVEMHAEAAAHARILPQGRRVFISGQAEKGDGTLASATAKTMESLGKTLEFLGMEKKHAVQVKCFVTPIKEAAVVRAELAKFFAPLPVPPVSLVEWDSSLPIEIEMVAGNGFVAEILDAPPLIAFLTPPGMTTPAVYCRVAEVSRGPLLFIGSLFGKPDTSGEAEVRDIFGQMKSILSGAGSDLRHLVKATYYCSGDESSKKLNEIRPELYDPKRPPAASKAMVKGAGRKGCTINVDMIAVPAM